MSVAQRMFGIESEYAVSSGRSRGDVLDDLMRTAQARLVNIPSARPRDLFLQNGSRFYVDCGAHPELSTPECTHPSELVRYVLAGDAIVGDLVRQVDVARSQRSSTLVFKCNVDYSGARTTWGCHESYLHCAEPNVLPEQLIPHLVSRIVFTGAGGFNTLAPGIAFVVSPRAPHLQRVVSHESTHSRGIFHTKNETLSAPGYHRLHLLCGESLCSHLATWLKVGTTALVVALIEAGKRPARSLRLRAPLEALRTFTSDPECRREVGSGSGKRDAVAIQRLYLERVEECLGESFLPEWAADVCREWRSILDRIEHRPESLGSTLDWAIKRDLYRNHAARRGVEWSAIPRWNHVVARIEGALRDRERAEERTPVERAIGPRSPIRPTIEGLSPYLEEHSLEWSGLRPFVDLRRELFEIDFRFGEIGEGGIFSRLDAENVLSHAVPGVENVKQAVTEPPSAGRARVRGEAIKKYAKRKGFQCNWRTVWDTERRRLLDLSDPFTTEASWKDFEESEVKRRGRARLDMMDEL